MAAKTTPRSGSNKTTTQKTTKKPAARKTTAERPAAPGPAAKKPGTRAPAASKTVKTTTAFELYRDGKGEWRWRLRHFNGNVLADSGQVMVRRLA